MDVEDLAERAPALDLDLLGEVDEGACITHSEASHRL